MDIHEKIKSAPTGTGVYIFKDTKGKSLYIGKALNLKKRAASYLKTQDVRLKKMISLSKKIEFKITGSQIEALILESQLIKKSKPQFNIMLRDDKQYFYAGITKDEFPRIFMTHQPFDSLRSLRTSPTTNYIGPFIDGTALKTTLRYLRKIFPYCTCKQKHNNFCLNYHIGKCMGFCCVKNPHYLGFKDYDSRRYNQNIKAIREILSGERKSLIRDLKNEMIEFGKRQDFERAMDLQNKLRKLDQVFENAKILRDKKEDIKAEESIIQLAKLLKLKNIPYRIEGYDISNIQGTNATGSMVVFKNGLPNKDEYRKFKIRTKKTSDDTGMLKEILSRRFRHREWSFPDLVIIDGGKGQLNATTSIIDRKSEVIALTKDKKHKGNKIFINNQKNAVSLSKLPELVKKLILNVDSEAHRFAIYYYRKLHSRKLI